MREITINQNDAGQRLDKFLTKYLVNMPQSMLYKSLRKNCVRVNGKHIKDGKYMLQDGDVLKYFLKTNFTKANQALKQAIPILTLYMRTKILYLLIKKAAL